VTKPHVSTFRQLLPLQGMTASRRHSADKDTVGDRAFHCVMCRTISLAYC